MKYLLFALVFVCLLCGSCLAESSDDVYVRKDVLTEQLKNINDRLDVLDKKIDSVIDIVKAQQKQVTELAQAMATLSERESAHYHELSQRIDDVNTNMNNRIDDLRNGLYLWLVFIGLIAGSPWIRKFIIWLNQQRTQITREDIRQLIREESQLMRQ